MNKTAKIATVTALLVAIVVMAVFVYAAPKKCNNDVDDDNDGFVDFSGGDPGCSSARDNDEHSATLVCDDGLDAANDRDTLVDYQISGGDAGCTSPTDASEVDGACDDLSDNDSDGFADFSADQECTNYADVEHDCTDSDGGFSYDIQGTVSGNFGGDPFSTTDVCIDSTTLRENFCTFVGYHAANTTVNCNTNATTMCSNGACI